MGEGACHYFDYVVPASGTSTARLIRKICSTVCAIFVSSWVCRSVLHCPSWQGFILSTESVACIHADTAHALIVVAPLPRSRRCGLGEMGEDEEVADDRDRGQMPPT